MAAAHVVTLAVRFHHRIVNIMELPQVFQQVTGEPGESFRLAHPAQRHFPIGALPTTFEDTPGDGEALTKERSAFPLATNLGPEIVKERREIPSSRDPRGCLRQIAKEFFIKNPPFLERDLALPVIEGKPGNMIASRHVQQGVFGGVVVDDQIEGDGSVSSRQTVQCEVFEPYAGMKKLGLVAGQDDALPLGK